MNRFAVTAVFVLCSAFSHSYAQTLPAYPARPVKLLLASSPGGGSNALGRVMSDALSQALRQAFVLENRAGANGVIASQEMLRAPADGYTLMVTQNKHTTNPALMKKLPYDTARDFTPVATIASSPLVLVASSASNVRTMKDFIELGRRDSKAMAFATSETSARLAVEMLADATGTSLASLPYKGTGPAIVDVAGGHVNFSITTMASVLPLRGSGKLNFIAVLGPERSPFMPDVPTLAQQGYPNITLQGWWGIFGPAGMPAAVVEQLNAAVRAALDQPEVRLKLQALSVEPWATSQTNFDAFIRKEIATNQALAKRAGLEPE